MPTATDHPTLAEWLKRVEARLVWAALNDASATVEQWRLPDGRAFLIIVYPNHGWEIFTPLDTVAIDATLRDAARRLGLV